MCAQCIILMNHKKEEEITKVPKTFLQTLHKQNILWVVEIKI